MTTVKVFLLFISTYAYDSIKMPKIIISRMLEQQHVGYIYMFIFIA